MMKVKVYHRREKNAGSVPRWNKPPSGISAMESHGYLPQSLWGSAGRQGVGLIVGNPDPVGLFEKGFEVWALNVLDLSQLAEFRYSLEIGAIGLAAKKASEDQMTRLRQLAREFEEIDSRKTSGRTAKETIGYDADLANQKSIQEHHEIAQALSERNADRAKAVLTDHPAGLLSLDK